MKKTLLLLAVLASLLIALSVPAAAYTIALEPPTGTAAGSPYVKLNVGGREGYIYPNAATLELLALAPGDRLSANLSTVGVPSYTTTGFQGTRLYTFAFYPSPDGDAQVSVLACYMMLYTAPGGGITYPCSIRWAWLTSGTNYFNGTAPQLIVGEPIVLDTNIPQFTPKNSELNLKSPQSVMLLVLGSLLCVNTLFMIMQQIGRYRKGASFG